MTQSNRFGPEPATPAFPGKIVVLTGMYPHAILADCRFERIAGRTYLVGTDRGDPGAAGGPTRALAWDSDAVRDLMLFDSLAAVEAWKPKPADDGIPF